MFALNQRMSSLQLNCAYLSLCVCFLPVHLILCTFVSVRRMAGTKVPHLPMPLSCLVGEGGTWVQVEWRNLPPRKTAL